MEDIPNMKIKKLLAVLLSAIMILGLTACNADDEAPVVPEAPEANEPAGDTNEPQGEEEPEENNEPDVTGRFDLSIPSDQEGGNGTWWGWVSDGTDNVYNGVSADSIQKARYLVIEFNGEADADAMAGLVWQSEANWGWNETSTFTLGRFMANDNLIVMPIYDIMENYNDFRFGELPQGFIKIILRYGNENDEAQYNYIERLNPTAIYLADSVNF